MSKRETVLYRRTPQGPEVIAPVAELDRERQLINQQNEVFRLAYERGQISKEQYDEAMRGQRARLSDTKGVPVEAQPYKGTTAYLASEKPFFQKDANAVVLPKQGIVYGGEFYSVDVPKNMVITGIARGEPVTETVTTAEGEFARTSTPLTLSFAMDPTYKAPPVPTDPLLSVPSGKDFVSALDPTAKGKNTLFAGVEKYQSQEKRARQYAHETGLPVETARKMVMQADVQQTLVKAALIGGVVSFAVSPTVAAIGAGSSVAISQTVKGVTQGELLTVEELAYAAGIGATFGVGGSQITSAATKAAPILAEQTVKGAVARIGFQTGLGAGVGASMSAGQTAILGGSPEQIAESAAKGAIAGGAIGATFATGTEVYHVAKPWIGRQFEGLKSKLSPERSMYERVVLDAQTGKTVSAERGLSMTERVRGVFRPEEAAAFRKTQPLTPDTKGTSILRRIGDTLRPENAMFRRVVGTSPKEATLKPTSSPDTFYSGGEFVPFKGGKGGLSSVLVVKQKPVVAKPMKPMPVQTAAWTADLQAVEFKPKPLEIKAETVSKTAAKSVAMAKTKTEVSTLAGTAEVVGFNPMLYSGPSFPLTGRRKRLREITESISLDYPASGLPHPPKMGDVLNTSRIESLGQQAQELTTVSAEKMNVDSLLIYGTKRRGMSSAILDAAVSFGVSPVFDVGANTAMATELTSISKTGTKQTQELTQGLKAEEISKQFQKGFLEVGLPEGFGRKSPFLGRGVGRQKRKYPIVTGADILESLLGTKKPTKKRKSKGGYKLKRVKVKRI